MKIFSTDGYLTLWDCLANIIKNNRVASLTSGSDYLLMDVTYVILHNK